MPLSIEDSILRLKAEIIAQDWRLSPKRAKLLEASFLCLLDHFKNRKATHAMLVMAANVLDYIKNRGASPPDTIDFLKEAMAHIVSVYEDLADDPHREEAIFKSLFARFTTLKGKIQQKVTGKTSNASTSTPGPSPLPQTNGPEQEGVSQANELSPLHQLIAEFKNSLSLAGEIGDALHQSFDFWLASPAVATILRGEPMLDTAIEEAALLPPTQGIYCPPTKVRILAMSGLSIAIQSNTIALVRPLKPPKAMAYLQNGSVPLQDFSRFLFKLSGLFNGSLALVKERILRELSLPIIMPQGHEFPDPPPLTCKTLVIISNGNWHGALACDDIQSVDRVMNQFIKQQNGDLAGTAYLDDGSQLPLLDPLSMLRREGILLMR